MWYAMNCILMKTSKQGTPTENNTDKVWIWGTGLASIYYLGNILIYE